MKCKRCGVNRPTDRFRRVGKARQFVKPAICYGCEQEIRDINKKLEFQGRKMCRKCFKIKELHEMCGPPLEKTNCCITCKGGRQERKQPRQVARGGIHLASGWAQKPKVGDFVYSKAMRADCVFVVLRYAAKYTDVMMLGGERETMKTQTFLKIYETKEARARRIASLGEHKRKILGL